MGTEADGTHEWIELYNTSSSDISLDNWSLKSDDGHPSTTLAGKLEAGGGGYYLMERNNDKAVSAPADWTGSFSHGLSNSDCEILSLYNEEGDLVDETTCEGDDWPAGSKDNYASMEKINPQLASDEESSWGTNDGETMNGKDIGGNEILGTPGEENSVFQNLADLDEQATTTGTATSSDSDKQATTTGEEAEDQTGLQVEADDISPANRSPNCDAGQNKIVNVGMEISFDSTESTDANGDELEYYWSFGDGVTKRGPTSTHSFSYPGSYLVNLRVTDGEFSDSDQLKVEVYPARIYISEFLPDPEGNDQEGEWIEVVNREDFAVNLEGFKLDDEKGGSSPFEIPEDTYLLPGQRTVFARKATGIALNNTEDAARLLYPSGDVLDKVEYSEPEEGMSAVKNGDSFLWTLYPTPGKENVVVAKEKKEETISKDASVKEAKLKQDKKIKTATMEVDSATEATKSLVKGEVKKARRPRPEEIDFFGSEALAEGPNEGGEDSFEGEKRGLEQTANLSRGAFGAAEVQLLLSVLLASGVFGLSVYLQRKGI